VQAVAEANSHKAEIMKNYNYAIPNVPGLRRDYSISQRMMRSQRLASERMRSFSSTSLLKTGQMGGDANPAYKMDAQRQDENQATGLSRDEPLEVFGANEEFKMDRTGTPSGTMRPWSANPANRKAAETAAPRWLSQAGEVLGFHCYFMESVPEYNGYSETTTERPRVRQINLTYYVQDSSVAMTEIKVPNSGMPQGRFLKRGRLAKDAAGNLFKPTDFRIGQEFVVNQRTFVVVDADERTRKWFKDRLGETLGASMPVPDDGFQEERAKFERTKRPQSTRTITNIYELDKTVLRFYCAHEDDENEHTHREYHMHYFVEDDTIEVKAVATEGTTRFPYLLRRQKLPYDSTNVPGNDKLQAHQPSRQITWEDLRCGETLTVYGHALLLMDVDERTRKWYGSRGISQKPLTLMAEAHQRQAIRVPPYNGFGSDEDLYAMGLSLEPAVTTDKQEAYSRFMRNEKKVMRFSAALLDLVTGEPIAQNREFVINYFLEDDTLSIFEPEQRNSGVAGGLFLTRMRYKKHIDAKKANGASRAKKGSTAARPRSGLLSRWFRPADFVEGADLTIEMPSTGCTLHRVRVLSMDEYTRSLLQKGTVGLSTEAGKIHWLIGMIAESCCTHRIPLRRLFEKHDPACYQGSRGTGIRLGAGKVKESVFRDVLMSLRLPRKVLAEENLDTLVWEFVGAPADQAQLAIATQREVDGLLVDYGVFVDAVVLATPEPRIVEQCNERNNAHSEISDDKLEESMLKILRNQFARGHVSSGRLRQTFRQVDSDHTGLISPEQWFQVLHKHNFHAIMSRSKADAIRRQYTVFDGVPQIASSKTAWDDANASFLMDYNRLCDDIFTGNFDSYVDRMVADVEEFTGGGLVELDVYARNDDHLQGSRTQRRQKRKEEVLRRKKLSAKSKSTASAPRQAQGGKESRKSAGMREARELDEEIGKLDLAGGEAEHEADAAEASRQPGREDGKMTLRRRLAEIHQAIDQCGGDSEAQFMRSLQSFASAFGRTHRKKLLRKNCMAFDPLVTGKLSKRGFQDMVKKSIREGFVDMELKHMQRIADFLYPRGDSNEHKFEDVLQVIFGRNLQQAKAMREQALTHTAHAESVFFR